MSGASASTRAATALAVPPDELSPQRAGAVTGRVDAEAYKTCACGRSYTAEHWSQLSNPRLWRLPWGEVQQLRQCFCGSTISIVLVSAEAAAAVVAATPALRYYATWYAHERARIVDALEYIDLHSERLRFYRGSADLARAYATEIAKSTSAVAKAQAAIDAALAAAARAA